MLRLFRVELIRAASRRVVKLFGLFAAIVVVIGAALVFFNTGNHKDPLELTILSEHGLQSGVLRGVMDVAIVIGFVLGATLVGADWRAGNVTTILLFEPRRARLALTRFLAVATISALFAVALCALVFLVLWPVAAVHGTTSGIGGHWLWLTSLGILRSACVIAISATLAAALAFITRNTAGALVIGAASVMIFQPVLSILRPGWTRWTFAANQSILLSGGTFDAENYKRSAGYAALVLVAYLAVIAAAAIALFKRRDIASSS